MFEISILKERSIPLMMLKMSNVRVPARKDIVLKSRLPYRMICFFAITVNRANVKDDRIPYKKPRLGFDPSDKEGRSPLITRAIPKRPNPMPNILFSINFSLSRRAARKTTNIGLLLIRIALVEALP